MMYMQTYTGFRTYNFSEYLRNQYNDQKHNKLKTNTKLSQDTQKTKEVMHNYG